MSLFDLKAMGAALDQLQEERGIPRNKVLEAIEMALAAAYKKDYGKKGQIVRAQFDLSSGDVDFMQVKIAVDESMLKSEEEGEEEAEGAEEDEEETVLINGEEIKKEKWNEERHIQLSDAKKIKSDVQLGEELTFPLENKEDYGRIAAQTAKQVIIQKIREAEKFSVLEEYGKRAGEIVNGTVQRIERGHVYVDLGRTTAVLYRDEQIPGEHYRQGERIKAYLVAVEETPRGIAVRLSRSHPEFVKKLFEIEAPEIAAGTVEITAIAREAGSRTKLAVVSHNDSIDAVGTCVGQRGVRVSTVISELGGEKIDIIEWSELPEIYISNALNPGKILSIELDEDDKEAKVEAARDQLSLVIGKGGQNVRLAAKLTGWKLDIESPEGEAPEKKTDDSQNDDDDEGPKELEEVTDEKEEEAKDDKKKEKESEDEEKGPSDDSDESDDKDDEKEEKKD